MYDKEQQVREVAQIGRLCSPTNVAGAFSLLVKPRCDFVAGTTINLTGSFAGHAATPLELPP